MSDAHESSYYEIALTHRQVLVFFVVLLASVLAAFVMGVWVGRQDESPRQVAEAGMAEGAQGEDLEGLEEFKFFSEKDGFSEKDEGELRKPDLGSLLEEPRRDTTLAQDVGAAAAAPPPPPQRSTPPPPPAAAPPRAAPPPSASPARSSPPAAASAEPTEGLIIQVFSSHDEAQAQRLLQRLRDGGYQAFLSPVAVGDRTMHRVRIGPYASRAPAERAAREVTQRYKLETWITAAGN